MKKDWQQFLEHNGAETDGHEVTSFGNPAREQKMVPGADIFADLSHLGFIAVHGEDAESFLQGQFSNDIRLVSDTQSQISSYSNPKGRLLAIFRVFRIDDTYYLHMPRSLIDSVLKRLGMYVIRAKVTLEDASENFIGLGVSGPEASTEVQKATGTNPEGLNAVSRASDLIVIRIPGVQPRYQIFGPLEAMQKCWDALNVRCAPVGRPGWELTDILAGIPTIYPETVETFVAQMTNLQLIDGVNFKKGCFPGQEIVARMQYLGKLKRRMYLTKIDSTHPPTPGTDIFSCRDEKAQSAGKIVSSQTNPDGGCTALAVLKINEAEDGELCVGSRSGERLAIEQLPYPFPAN